MNRSQETAPPDRRFTRALAAILISALAASAGGCDGAHGTTPTAGGPDTSAQRVKVVKPTRQDIVRRVLLPASVRADLEVTLFSKVTGFLKEITKDRGDRVKSGELIATLEIPEMISEIDHARASHALDETTFNRLEAIRKVEKTAVTDQDLDMARAKRDMSKATLKKLETLQSYTEIRAPFNGLVTERFVDPGAFIQQGKIVSMVDISKVRVLVDIPESEAPHASVGVRAQVQLDALPGKVFQAAISRSAGALDPTLRTMRVEIDVPNPEFTIYPGMFARVALAVDRHAHALVVPAGAVVLQQDRAFVFIDANGKAKKVQVTPGTEDGSWWEIQKGLTGEESVILPEGRTLTEGMPIRPADGVEHPPMRMAEGGNP
jgi:membrane fusion protein (multidrug efflux system)